MHKYRVLFCLIVLFVAFPCMAFAIGTLQIDGSVYDSTALAGSLSGTGWSWSATANGGQGELALSGYNGSTIAATDGVLNIRLSGENIITSAEKDVLKVSGNDTGLNIVGSDPKTDTLLTRSTFNASRINDQIAGINVSITNAATLPFSFRNISYILDVSQASANEILPGWYVDYTIYGINIKRMANNTPALGIDLQMDNTIITMRNGSDHGTFSYGMWASPEHGSIEAVFNRCTLNLSEFESRGWYTGRDLASYSRATYNDCIFNIHGAAGASGAIGLHISSNVASSTSYSSMTLNNPSGEIETEGLSTLYARSSNPSITIRDASVQAWQLDGTEIENPHVVTVFSDFARTTKQAYTIGSQDVVAEAQGYKDSFALRIVFHPLPPQTGDKGQPLLYAGLLLMAAAGLCILRVKSTMRAHRRQTLQ